MSENNYAPVEPAKEPTYDELFKHTCEMSMEIEQLQAKLEKAKECLNDLEFWSCTACDENKKLRDETLKEIEGDL